MPVEFRKILVPIDFSDNSLTALHYAAEIAKKINAEIITLHVVETYEYNQQLGIKVDYKEDFTKQLLAKLDEFRAEHSNLWGIPLKTMLVSGKIYKQIIETSEQVDADLIVMGTHGASGMGNFEKYFLGSNAYRVVNNATCPVITIKGDQKKVSFKNILLPLDLTKTTDKKVKIAIRTAKYFGSTIHVLSIYQFLEDMTKSVEKLDKKMDAVAEIISAEGIPCETASISNQDISRSVLKYARDNEIDLIIIMTRQEKHLNEIFLGSHARKIIENSMIPVLSVHPTNKQKI